MKVVGYLPTKGKEILSSSVRTNKGLATVTANKVLRQREQKKQQELTVQAFAQLKRLESNCIK